MRSICFIAIGFIGILQKGGERQTTAAISWTRGRSSRERQARRGSSEVADSGRFANQPVAESVQCGEPTPLASLSPWAVLFWNPSRGLLNSDRCPVALNGVRVCHANDTRRRCSVVVP